MLPGPNKVPTTDCPTSAYTFPPDKPDTLIHTLVSNKDATLFKGQENISAEKITWAVGVARNERIYKIFTLFIGI